MKKQIQILILAVFTLSTFAFGQGKVDINKADLSLLIGGDSSDVKVDGLSWACIAKDFSGDNNDAGPSYFKISINKNDLASVSINPSRARPEPCNPCVVGGEDPETGAKFRAVLTNAKFVEIGVGREFKQVEKGNVQSLHFDKIEWVFISKKGKKQGSGMTSFTDLMIHAFGAKKEGNGLMSLKGIGDW